jgi:hypothetical protein
MKNLVLFCLGALVATVITAQSQGPLSGGTFSNLPIGGSKASWTGVGNVATSDNIYASFGNISGAVGGFTDYLIVSNFGFTIPTGVIIDGIVVEVERSDPNVKTSDFHVQLIKNSVISATDKAVAALWPATDSYQPYGTPTDLWGNTWASTDINATNFGVAIAAQRGNNGGTTAGRIDHVRITVYYHSIALPLKLVDFTAQKIDNTVRLSWVTADEANMDHFEIERSQSARDFASIGNVIDQNLVTQNNYSFDDVHPLKNISYYRLKMVSNGGAVTYSRIIPVQFNSGKGLTLYPTLWHPGTPLNIANSNNEKLTVRFFTESGQSLGTTTTKSNLVSPDGFSNYHGWTAYRIYDERHQLKGTGKILVE